MPSIDKYPFQQAQEEHDKNKKSDKKSKPETLFPPVFGQIYKPPATKEEKDAWDLGARIADEHYKAMKKKFKEDFLRLSHITEITTDEVIKTYNEIDKFHFPFARNGYVTRAREKGYIAKGENYLFFFMCGWNSATNKPEVESTA